MKPSIIISLAFFVKLILIAILIIVLPLGLTGYLWYRWHKKHSNSVDEPAIVGASGTKEWYKEGPLHDKDKPAIERANRMKCW